MITVTHEKGYKCGVYRAHDGDLQVGTLSYLEDISQPVLLFTVLEVIESHRRQRVAVTMMERMVSDYPHHKINSGMRNADAEGLYQYLKNNRDEFDAMADPTCFDWVQEGVR